ncbi:hypothetical protein V8C86DRAFT_92121 [Haematococcus lacustris]
MKPGMLARSMQTAWAHNSWHDCTQAADFGRYLTLLKCEYTLGLQDALAAGYPWSSRRPLTEVWGWRGRQRSSMAQATSSAPKVVCSWSHQRKSHRHNLANHPNVDASETNELNTRILTRSHLATLGTSLHNFLLNTSRQCLVTIFTHTTVVLLTQPHTSLCHVPLTPSFTRSYETAVAFRPAQTIDEVGRQTGPPLRPPSRPTRSNSPASSGSRCPLPLPGPPGAATGTSGGGFGRCRDGWLPGIGSLSGGFDSDSARSTAATWLDPGSPPPAALCCHRRFCAAAIRAPPLRPPARRMPKGAPSGEQHRHVTPRGPRVRFPAAETSAPAVSGSQCIGRNMSSSPSPSRSRESVPERGGSLVGAAPGGCSGG